MDRLMIMPNPIISLWGAIRFFLSAKNKYNKGGTSGVPQPVYKNPQN